MQFFANHRRQQRSGFTLVELLITIAITGIITGIVFTGLRQEQQRSASKDAADRIQVALFGLQNKTQSAVTLATKYCTRSGGSYTLLGKGCDDDTECATTIGTDAATNVLAGRCVQGPPTGYGALFTKTGANGVYTEFADMPWGLSPAEGVFRGATFDKQLGLKSYGENLTAHQLYADGVAVNRIDVVFSGTGGRMTICKQISGGCAAYAQTARIVLQHAQTGSCYAINLSAAAGIISRREYSSNCQ